MSLNFFRAVQTTAILFGPSWLLVCLNTPDTKKGRKRVPAWTLYCLDLLRGRGETLKPEPLTL